MEQNIIKFEGIQPFVFDIQYNELDHSVDDQHIHSECEIYINLSGDVSFMVENNIYPIKPGNIIITRPYEHHHCIYHSNALHKHFWILFSGNTNEKYLGSFYDRKIGENNLIVLTDALADELNSICFEILNTKQGEESYLLFFKIIDIIKNGNFENNTSSHTPYVISEAIENINNNISNPILISDLAKQACMSINTFERHFKKHIGMSPNRFIFQRKMEVAARSLIKGFSVYEACEHGGFSDYSHFISSFKKQYGTTPLQYQKQNLRN